MPTVTLSPAALALLRRRLAGERVAVTDENRPIYRELVAAALMEPLSTFLHGGEGNYRPTAAAYVFAANGSSTPTPAPAEVSAPHG
jgi:hypothetical protein